MLQLSFDDKKKKKNPDVIVQIRIDFRIIFYLTNLSYSRLRIPWTY